MIHQLVKIVLRHDINSLLSQDSNADVMVAETIGMWRIRPHTLLQYVEHS